MLTLDGSEAGNATFNGTITSGGVITSGAGLVIADAGNIGSASDTDAIAIASNGVTTFSQAPVLSGASITAGTTPITALDIDGGTDIGAGLADADLFIVDDGAGGTNRKVAASRITTYINSNANFASVGKAIAMAIVFG
jgi:acyl dehydratase